MGERMIKYHEVDQMKWRVETQEHSRQRDGFNCGVYCLLVGYNNVSETIQTNTKPRLSDKQ